MKNLGELTGEKAKRTALIIEILALVLLPVFWILYLISKVVRLWRREKEVFKQ